MSSSFDDEARAEADPATARPMLVIWSDWKGDLYAFCSRDCQRHYQAWVSNPNYLFERATSTDASFGCFWCGGDLTRGTVWLGEGTAAVSRVTDSPRE